MGRHRRGESTECQSLHMTALYRGGNHLDERFHVRKFADATYVQGETLRRYWHRPDLESEADRPAPDAKYFLVYSPTNDQLEQACDRCASFHKPTNPVCARNTVTKQTPMVDPTTLYNFVTPLAGPNVGFDVLAEDQPLGRTKVHGEWIRLLPK